MLRTLLLLLLLGQLSVGQQFKHIVYVIQENRTPDNLFGSNPTFEPGVDIATSGVTSKGLTVLLTSVPLVNCYDLGHAHRAFVIQYNKGKMDSSDKVGVSANCPLGIGANPQYRYVDNSKGAVQPYFDLATQYGFANRMFQSNQGPSFAAHQFLFSGTSAPSDTSNLFVTDSPLGFFAGCASTPATTVATIAPSGAVGTVFPCFEKSTLAELMEDANLTWKYYSVAGAQSAWNPPNTISNVCNATVIKNKLQCAGTEWTAHTSSLPSVMFSDIADCNLANVVWITPSGQNSDHPSSNTGGGPSWVASIVNAIGNSKCGYWQNTAILITWDDWGGWYDHVEPTVKNADEFGFRVPLVVVSAYTPAGYVSNTNHDFGSMLKFAEFNFGLGLIGPGDFADSTADDLAAFFPMTIAKPFVTINSTYDAAHFINSKEVPLDPDDD